MAKKDNRSFPTNNDEFDRIAETAKERAEEICTTFLNRMGEPVYQKTPGEIRYGKKGHIRVALSGPYRGTVQDFKNPDIKGHPVRMIKHMSGCSWKEAFDEAKSILGITDTQSTLTPQKPAKSKEQVEREIEEAKRKKISLAQWLWNKHGDRAGAREGQSYLSGRAITTLPPKDTMKYRILDQDSLDKMDLNPEEKAKITHPIVSVCLAATDDRGQITGIQQIFTMNGKKAPFDVVKMTQGHVSGSAVKLGAPNPKRVIVVEGPETGLSVFQAVSQDPEFQKDTAVWISLGISNYTKLKMPRSVESVIVGADMDTSGIGLSAAMNATQHYRQQGVRRVGIALPRVKSGDFNDVLKQEGTEAVRRTLHKAFFPNVDRFHDEVLLVTASARCAFHVWQKTGIETAVRVPAKKREGGHYPIHLSSVVEERHKTILLIKTPGIDIVSEELEQRHKDKTVVVVSEDSRAFLKEAQKPGFVETKIGYLADVHAPSGLGEQDPIALCLRRPDADAFDREGQRSAAIRPTTTSTIPLEPFLKRDVYIAPLGTGTSPDRALARRLTEAQQDEPTQTPVIYMRWPHCKPDGEGGYVHTGEPGPTFGAAQAQESGWSLKDLMNMARQDWERTIGQSVETKDTNTHEKPQNTTKRPPTEPDRS